MDYLGFSGPFSYGCDVTDTSTNKPWRRKTITREQIVQALPTESACLSLLRDVEGADYSTNSIVRCLAGKPLAFNNRLTSHPSFGRLAFLGADGVRAKLDELEYRGLIHRVMIEKPNASYESYRISKPEV
jgi:hypothetical protein